MKKLLFFIIALCVFSNTKSMAQFDSGTNSYNYGCGAGVPPSACGVGGSYQSSSSPSSNTTNDCKAQIDKAATEVAKAMSENGAKVSYKFLQKVPEMANGYAYGFTIGDGKALFVFDANTGDLYAQHRVGTQKGKVEKLMTKEVFKCR